MAFRVLEDRILVRRVAAVEVSKGGIIIPDTVQEKPQVGTVVYTGPGLRNKDGSYNPVCVNVGDEILFGKWCDTEMTVEGEKLLLLREDEVLGTMN